MVAGLAAPEEGSVRGWALLPKWRDSGAHTLGVASSYGCSDMSAQVTLKCGLPLGPATISEGYRHFEPGFVHDACLRDV